MRKLLPNSWLQTTLGGIGRLNTSSVDKLVRHNEDLVSLVNYMDIYCHRQISSALDLQTVTATKEEQARFQVGKGDVLFTPSSETPDDIGHSAVISDDLPNTLHSYHTVRLRPDGNVPLDVGFSGYFANSESVLRYFSRRAAGSTRYTLSLDSFRCAPVNLPPIEQQRDIAEILSTADEAIEQTEALIAKTQQIKAGLMHDLFTRGVTADGQLRPPREEAPHLYKESPLGWIPKEWDTPTLSTIADLDVGFAFKSESFRPEGVNLLRGENVGYGRPDWSDRQCLDPSRAQEFAPYELQPGDVVIGMDRTFTKSGVKITVLTADDCPALLVQRVGRYRALTCDKAYLRWLIETTTYLRALYVQQKGMDIPHLSRSEILGPRVPLASEIEQLTIVAKLDEIGRVLQFEKSSMGKLRAIKSGLMHDLLTGDVSVMIAAKSCELANV